MHPYTSRCARILTSADPARSLLDLLTGLGRIFDFLTKKERNMKKILFVLIVFATLFAFTGCNSCTQTFKNLESDFSELDRNITVINAIRGDTIFSYSGPCYISDGANPGDVTLIYKVGKKSKKADFLGEHVIFVATEK